MPAGIVTIGRQPYAVGLYWENSPGTGRVAQQAKEAANQAGQTADFYAVRSGNKDGRVPQFGLCSGEAGQKAGMPVLAACLASQIPGSWAGAFRINEGTVVIIVRDDLIVPDGDQFFTDENEAHDRLVQEIGFGGLQNIYAPESWSVPGGDSIPLTLLLSDRKNIKLQAVRIPQQVKILAGILVLLFILGLAGLWYWQAQEEAEREAEAAQRAREAALSLSATSQAPPPPKYDRKWESSPPALDVIENCRKGLALIPAAVAGWHMEALHCTGTGIYINWMRDSGASAPPAGAVVNEAVSSASQTINLPPLLVRGDEALADPDVITTRYLGQNWPGNLVHAADDPAPPPPPGYNGVWNPPPAPWVKRSFTLSVPELPGQTPVLFKDLPGVVVSNLAYVSSGGMDGKWTVEGVIYENRK